MYEPLFYRHNIQEHIRRPIRTMARRQGLKKYQIAGGVAAGIASMAAKKALNWYGKPRQTTTRSRTVKSKPMKVKPFPSKVKQQIRELKRLTESDMGTHIQRRRQTGALSASVNSKSTGSADVVSLSIIEGVIAQLRYYNPSAPTALVTADGASGTYQKEFLFNSMYHKINVVNNYQVPAKVKLYLVRSKMDTSISASTSYTNGLADVGNPTATSTLVHLTDSTQFTDLYNIVGYKSTTLIPGENFIFTHSDKSFQYDPSLSDSHALTYQKRFKDLQFVLVVQGVLGHDTIANEQTTLQASVDYSICSTFTVRYSAGADIKFIYIDDTGDASFTNGGVVSSKPVCDNIGYSVS